MISAKKSKSYQIEASRQSFSKMQITVDVNPVNLQFHVLSEVLASYFLMSYQWLKKLSHFLLEIRQKKSISRDQILTIKGGADLVD